MGISPTQSPLQVTRKNREQTEQRSNRDARLASMSLFIGWLLRKGNDKVLGRLPAPSWPVS